MLVRVFLFPFRLARFLFTVLVNKDRLAFLLRRFLVLYFRFVSVRTLWICTHLFGRASNTTVGGSLTFMSTRVYIEVLNFFMTSVVKTIIFMLLYVFSSFHGIFSAIFRFRRTLLYELSNFNFCHGFIFRFYGQAGLVVTLYNSLWVLGNGPPLRSQAILGFLIENIGGSTNEMIFFKSGYLSFPFSFGTFP